MTVKIDKQRVPAGDAELDCIAWVRSVRDAMYEATSELPPDEFISYVHRAARAVDAGAGVPQPSSGMRTASHADAPAGAARRR